MDDEETEVLLCPICGTQGWEDMTELRPCGCAGVAHCPNERDNQHTAPEVQR